MGPIKVLDGRVVGVVRYHLLGRKVAFRARSTASQCAPIVFGETLSFKPPTSQPFSIPYFLRGIYISLFH